MAFLQWQRYKADCKARVAEQIWDVANVFVECNSKTRGNETLQAVRIGCGKITRNFPVFGNQIIVSFNGEDIRPRLNLIQQVPFKGHKTAMQLPSENRETVQNGAPRTVGTGGVGSEDEGSFHASKQKYYTG